MSELTRFPVKIARAIRRERPLRTLRTRMLVAFPWEVGYLRFLWFTRCATKPAQAYETPDEGTKETEYSASYLTRYAPDRRVEWTLFLLASIPDCEKDSLLILGPRYEPELLMAQGLGWAREGIRGLDTFSYSPSIDVGDMHSMPYDDERFASIICGWTLSYSDRPDVAAAEMTRVLRPGGYLIVSMQKVAPDHVEVLQGVLKGEHRIQTLAQLDALYAGLDRVAGFEPTVALGGEGHTIAAYRRPRPA